MIKADSSSKQTSKSHLRRDKMTSGTCRFCLSESATLLTSIYDEIVGKFIKFVPSIVISDGSNLSKKICQLCVGKINVCCRFIARIHESQMNFQSKAMIQTPQQVLLKMQSNKGISIKRIEKEPEVDDQTVVEYLDIEDDVIDIDGTVEKLDDLEEIFENEACDTSSTIPATDSFSESSTIPKYISAVKFACSKCMEMFKDFETLSEHIKTKTCAKFTCNICSKEFRSKKNLTSHKAVHRQKISCDSCGMSFLSQSDYKMHLEAIHKKLGSRTCSYRCAHCFNAFTSQLELLSHMKVHKELNDGPRLCEICARECPSRKSYNSHMQNHNAKKSFVCTVCGKAFFKSFQLIQHMHLHSGMKDYKCEVCDKSYVKRQSLRAHKKKEHLLEDDE